MCLEHCHSRTIVELTGGPSGGEAGLLPDHSLGHMFGRAAMIVAVHLFTANNLQDGLPFTPVETKQKDKSLPLVGRPRC